MVLIACGLGLRSGQVWYPMRIRGDITTALKRDEPASYIRLSRPPPSLRPLRRGASPSHALITINPRLPTAMTRAGSGASVLVVTASHICSPPKRHEAFTPPPNDI
ncbi:hypothetical protein LX36DRAFT_464932 [Colletotrichum falcatum]|nr:hypothetical protein LX36DRAFT_464932 [Colletotrichum falcatum]